MAAAAAGGGAGADPLLSKFQRDLNCVADPDRSTRTRALKKLDDALFGRRSCDFDAPGDRSRFLARGLLQALLGRLADPVEKCRELALAILAKLLENDENGAAKDAAHALEPSVVDGLAAEMYRVSEQRLGEQPFPEPSEEIRLSWLELLQALLAHPNATAATARDANRLAGVLASAAADTFPDVKRECAKCCIILCERFPDALHMQLDTVLTPMLANMSHQHSKVRQASLEAIRQLVLVGAKSSSDFEELMSDKVVPVIRKINHDRASAVRILGMELISDLLVSMPNAPAYRKDLLPIVLFGLADPAQQIQELTLKTIETIGAVLSSSGNEFDEPQPPEPPQAASLDADLMPEPFRGRPGPGARRLVSEAFESVLPAILSEAGDWNAQERFRGVALLRCMLVFAEDSAQPFVGKILPVLFAAVRDDEPPVRDAAMDCATLLGHFIPTPQIFKELIPHCLGTAMNRPEDPESFRQGALAVLASAMVGLAGDSNSNVLQHLDEAAAVLGATGLSDTESVPMQCEMLKVVQGILERFVREKGSHPDASLSPSTACAILRALLLIVSTPHSDEAGQELRGEAEDAIALLAGCAGLMSATGEPDTAQLCEICAPQMIDAALRGVASFSAGECQTAPTNPSSSARWTKGDTNRRVFDQIVRRTGTTGLARCNQVDVVVAVLLATAPADREPDLRLAMLSLLETLLADSGDALDRHVESLVNEILLPNMIWRAGRVAATIRKVSLFCFAHFVGCTKGRAAWFAGELPRLVPTIKGCLDDQEADTRRFACQAFTNLFKCVEAEGTPLAYELVLDVYHDLVKRFDDADDATRIAACAALCGMITNAPIEALRGTVTEYVSDVAFVHLDDGDATVKDAVLTVIEALVERGSDVATIVAKADAHRARHRTPEYCDRVKAAAAARA